MLMLKSVEVAKVGVDEPMAKRFTPVKVLEAVKSDSSAYGEVVP